MKAGGPPKGAGCLLEASEVQMAVGLIQKDDQQVLSKEAPYKVDGGDQKERAVQDCCLDPRSPGLDRKQNINTNCFCY